MHEINYNLRVITVCTLGQVIRKRVNRMYLHIKKIKFLKGGRRDSAV